MTDKYSQYDDAELYALLCESKEISEKAFAELYTRHSSKIYAYIRRFLGGREEANDVFQETFVRFHQSASKDREMTNVPAFLLKIARNLCVNALRRDKKNVEFEEYMVVKSEDRSDKDELLNLIKSAMELLPDDYREVFVLREYEGLSYAEIADVTNESLANVKVRIYRAKQKIREILAPYLKELEKF